ncbi:mucosa-associated lymphoid tissue lymphoma translocation protein 1 isoform X1 [Erpetoichthys calabaricus]|uniref:MALT1 paracaspase n=1 Tax=Erpetoichthys calabaricus TaxID=27687 RepID=A0A8C4RNN3_ERPCA|nr:mucosa-associated lymphoid tissue lymphoma translocation protein 1 isoform X1 [Erpetoichthys calabaricus]XP_028658338.1 mucosa-associated lymphoid tissue lymphoma translocation protein 1 isoform X1 [Erpetoichthys calabaricus]XP_051783583.1 mucosa-associated lymphoid tissue lymphoma translocation protein 1 isoform X1 [Erpetoichthys calabaricus]
MSDSHQHSLLNINDLREPILKKLCEVLDKTNNKGWRKLAEVVSDDRRFKVSGDEMEKCSLKVLDPEGSPSRSLLWLMGERGCSVRNLTDFLHKIGNVEAVQCLKTQGIKIIIQPQSQAVLSGHIVRLGCHAAGHPNIQYQWFKFKEEIPCENSPELVFNPVNVNDTGFYICRVNCGNSFEFSSWAKLEVCDVNVPYGSMFSPTEGRLKVVIHPQTQKLMVGDTLELECGAVGKPLPQYQWYRNGAPLKDAAKKRYTIFDVSVEHQGRFRCQVFNEIERQWSREVEVLIGPRCNYSSSEAVECSEDDVNIFGDYDPVRDEGVFATDKVALLIGNMSYRNHPKLKAPMVDVYDLTNLLRQLNFKVVSLLDLTESEMRNAVDEFLLLLDKGVYGLLYYAGHGYENYGNSFMVPVDAPNPYHSANCLCVQSILKLMQEKETGLNVFLLDMCRKRNVHDDRIPNVEALRVTANIVFGYATCQDAEAFELNSTGLTNGVFIKFLKKRLLEHEKITVVLDRVAEDMGKFDPTKGKQALEIRSCLSEKRSLTDPIQPIGCSAEAMARNLQWAKAHELPESMCLDFDCGVKIKLGFAAEFSNVMVIYTSIVKKPIDMTSCQAYVTNFTPDLDVDPKETNKVTPEETGSYLLSKSLPEHCLYTRLSSLQKLKEHLTFTVCLQGRFTSVDDLVDWRKEVNIGKPLIAKLDIHRQVRRNSCLQTCRMPHSPSHSPGPSPSHSPSTEHQYHQYSHQPFSSSHLGVYHHGHAFMSNMESPPPVDDFDCSRMYSNISHYSQAQSIMTNRINVPIETTDDINELHSSFIDSLELNNTLLN